jgi:D-alanyl-D-alanine carboxypeptidase
MKKPSRLSWFLFGLVLAASMSSAASAAEGGCMSGPEQPALANTSTMAAIPVNVFGRVEAGWAFYAPLTAAEIGTVCPGDSPAFAAALERWQAAHGLPPTGIMDQPTLTALTRKWQAARPFVIQSHRACPAPPPEQTLASAAATESYGGKAILLRPEALAAYRRLVQSARADGVLPPGTQLLAIFSGYRSPTYDAARCLRENNCQGLVRAACSAHRTGLAMDLYLGAAPGFTPDSSADANRLFISRTVIYRWLVKNAERFGFVNYPFEPWHWEFISGG